VCLTRVIVTSKSEAKNVKAGNGCGNRRCVA
jgi:hypothetical protein